VTTVAQDDLTLFVTGVHTDNFPAIQVDLRAIDSSNQVVNNLDAASLTVTEAGSPVKDFKLTPNTDGAAHIVFVIDLDVYNSFSYSPSIPEMQAIFTTLAGPNYFVDGRDTVQVVGRINNGSDQTVELLKATHKGVDLVNWAQGFNFKGGSRSTNGLLAWMRPSRRWPATETPGRRPPPSSMWAGVSPPYRPRSPPAPPRAMPRKQRRAHFALCLSHRRPG